MVIYLLFILSQTCFIYIFFNFLNQFLSDSICINSAANPRFWGNGEVERQGDETECALLELAYKLGYNYEDYRPSSKVL